MNNSHQTLLRKVLTIGVFPHKFTEHPLMLKKIIKNKKMGKNEIFDKREYEEL